MDAKTLIAHIVFAASIIASVAFTPLAFGDETSANATPATTVASAPTSTADANPRVDVASESDASRVSLLIPYRKHGHRVRTPASLGQ